jgi:YidC/Oxa1 family membrane protein insertase
MGGLIASNIQFPSSSGLGAVIFALLKVVYDIVGNYGVAVIAFTIFMRLLLLPLDYLNKYMTKKNQAKMAEFKPELDKVNQIYAGDMMARNRAQQAVYRKHGYSQGGFCLFMLLNIVVTLVVFITVLSCLNELSTHNVARQRSELVAVYNNHYTAEGALKDAEGYDAFKTQLNKVYAENKVGFLWIDNIFQPDTYASKFSMGADTDRNKVIIEALDAKHTQGWNGLFILVIAAAITSYFSMKITMAAQAKKKAEATTIEPVVQYSMRNTREAADPNAIPAMDPAMMGKVMKWILPAIMVMITFTNTAAFALYLTVSSTVQVGAGLVINKIVDKRIAKLEQKKKEDDGGTIINPHARYFKRKN